MRKYLFIFFILLTLFFFHCKNKKEKIELKQSKKDFNEALTVYSNTKLTPATFFKITLSINKITAKYKNMSNEDQDNIDALLEKRENEINEVYEKYEVSEDEFNQFGQTQYRELESYLRKHPQIDEQLRHVN